MLIIGHRGAMGLEPENTLRSFRKALEIGVDMVEFDAYVLPSGEIVIIHDDDVSRTTNGHGKVWDFSLKALRELDAGKGEKIPTIEEVLDLVSKKVPVNIELKGPNTAGPIKDVINLYINNGWDTNDFIVSSFRHDELNRFKLACPEIRVAVLLNNEQWGGLSSESY